MSLPQSKMMTKVKALSFNCNGLFNATKRHQVFNHLKSENVDIFLLQESHSIPKMENVWTEEWGGKIYYSHGLSNSRGVCILFKPGLSPTIHEIKRDDQGRVLCIDVEMSDTRFTLANIYAPNNDNPDFFKECFKFVEHFENSSKIIGGDFNLVLDLKLDKKGGAPVTHFKCRETLELYMEKAELLDIWRHQHPDEKKFTWHRMNPSPIFCRLDMMLVSSEMSGSVENSEIFPGFKSDHSIVMIELNMADGNESENSDVMLD